MAFPTTPRNLQLYRVNGIVYQYNSTLGAWVKYQSNTASNISVNSITVTGNATVGAVYTNSYFLANGAAFTGTAGFTGSVGFVGSTGASGFVGSAGAAAVVPKITAITYPGNDTAADTAGGQTITLTGSGFAAGASVVINGALVGVVTVVNSTTITFVSPALATGSYIVYVVNTDGTTAIAVPGIQYSGTPAWSTAAGSLGSLYETQAFSSSVTATGDAAITYSLQSGSLPPGATFNANGTISGTSAATASPTTYTFTVRATDAQNQDTDRTFSITVNPDAVTWNSPTNGTVYSVSQNSIISNVSLSATSAAGYSVQYAANALPTGLTLSGNIISGTPTSAGNTNTLLTATAVTSNRNATQTISWVVSIAADTFFPYVTTLLSASTPASTFVTDASTNAFNVTVNGDARPSNFGPYTPGYYSNYFDGTADFLTVPSNAALAFGTGAYTVEFWVYLTSYVNASNRIMDLGQANGSFGVQINNSSTIVITKYGAADLTASSASFTLNTWNHIAVVRTSTSTNGTAYYLNGVNVGTITDNNDWTVVTTPRINGISGFSFDFAGYLSNLRILKGTALYTANFTPPTEPLTAIADTSLLTCQSNRFIDNSTNNFAVARNGDTLISGFDPFVPSTSFAGRGSGYFDGTGDYLNVPGNSAFEFGTGNMTMEAYVYRTVSGTVDTIIQYGRASVSNYDGISWSLFISSSNYAGFEMSDGGSAALIALTSSVLFPLNAWTHLALVRSGNNFTLYQNGVSVATGSTSASFYIPSSSLLWIARNHSAGTADTAGYISDVRIVKGTAVYATAFTPPTAPLTAIASTSLLTLQSNRPNNNSMFLDSSTNNFNITRNGNTTQGTFSPYGGGWSAYFDGDGDNLILAPNAGFSFGTGDFTVEFWVYYPPYSNVDGKMVLDSRPGSSNGPYWCFGANGSGVMSFTTMTTGGVTLYDTVARTNQWVHYAATRSGTSLRLFANGTQVASATNSDNISSSDLRIGTNAWAGSAPTTQWVGYISNVRIVKGTAVYTSNFTPSTTPLTPIANTQLLTCADNRFIDDSANNFAITRNGNTSIQRFSPWNPVVTTPTSYSGFFDGSGDYLSINYASGSTIAGDFTWECWAYDTGATGYGTLLGWRNGGAGFTGFIIQRNNNNNVLAVMNNSALTITQTSNTYVTNQWNHVALVRSGSTVTLYVNGTSVGSGTLSGSFNPGSSYWIGSDPFNNVAAVQLQGYVSNQRFVNGTALYTSNFTPSTTPLTAIANTSLLTCQSATFTDTSINNFAITANGNTVPRQFNPFGWTTTTGTSAAYTPAVYGGSAYFDGTGDFLTIASNAALSWGTGDYTVEAWVYLTSLQSRIMVVSGVGNFAFFTNSSGNVIVGRVGTDELTSTGTVALNQWVHIAATRASNTTRIFINGTLSSTPTSITTNYGQNLAYIGSDATIMTTGYISDFRATKGQARYTSNFQPPVAPLTALQNTVLLNNMTGAGIYDSAMMANYETVGNAGINTALKKYGNTSMSFDGTGDYVFAPSNATTRLTGDFTIELWAYRAASGNYRAFTIGDSVGTSGIEIYVSGANWVVYSNSATRITGASATRETWTHLALVRSGSTVTLYVNGTVSGSTWSSSATFSGAVYVGAEFFNGGVTSDTNGYIDDFRITNGIARYTTNFTPTSSPFILN